MAVCLRNGYHDEDDDYSDHDYHQNHYTDHVDHCQTAVFVFTTGSLQNKSNHGLLPECKSTVMIMDSYDCNDCQYGHHDNGYIDYIDQNDTIATILKMV